jgi:HEPN domain-containing protein
MPKLASDDWREWLEYAKSDYEEAISALNRSSFKECFHAQQSCEKLLKAILIKKGMFIPIHDLMELAREVGVEEPMLLNKLSRLTIHYYTSARYGVWKEMLKTYEEVKERLKIRGYKTGWRIHAEAKT